MHWHRRTVSTLLRRDGSGDSFRVIGSIEKVLVAPENPEAVLAAMVDPEIRIVSLTVTEKGYCYSPASASLDERHEDIVHDLADPATPRSAIGFIVEALARRRDNGTEPFTLLSCDNLPANGETLKRVVIRFAELRDSGLGKFIRDKVAFPQQWSTASSQRQPMSIVRLWPRRLVFRMRGRS